MACHVGSYRWGVMLGHIGGVSCWVIYYIYWKELPEEGCEKGVVRFFGGVVKRGCERVVRKACIWCVYVVFSECRVCMLFDVH